MKTQIEIDPKLNEFLIKHRAKRKFIRNTKESFGFHEESYPLIKDIGEAFIWAETPEGHLFWEKLQSKFTK